MSNIYWLLNRSFPIALNIELSEAVLNERDRSIESSTAQRSPILVAT